MGTPNFAVPILKSLFDSKHKILEVYSQPPKKKNRGQKLQRSPIHDLCDKLKISVRNPVSLEDSNELEHIKKLNPDVVIVVAYGKILPKSLLNIKNFFFLNVHASLLPRWRGAAPIQRAIMNMDDETGVSIMKIVHKLDAGPVLMKSKIKITKDLNYQELSDKMSRIGAKLILDSLKLINDNNAVFTDQNEKKVTYAQKIQKKESKINWNEDACKVIAKINAFSPSPGSWFELFGSRVKIIKAKEVSNSGKPGVVLNNDFLIACLKNSIQPLRLKKEGKKEISIKEFLNGNQIKIGQKLI
jgi:methionyl-tRNA formyltransferase